MKQIFQHKLGPFATARNGYIWTLDAFGYRLYGVAWRIGFCKATDATADKDDAHG